MKKILMLLFAISLALNVNAQRTSKPVDPKVTEEKDKQQVKQDEIKKKQAEDREKQKQKIDEEKRKRQEKLDEDKKKREQKLEEQKHKKSPSSTTTPRRRTKTDPNAVEPDPEVVQLYLKLPLSALPQIKEYIKVMKPINNNDDLKDGKNLRRGFIAKTDATRQYINLQRPGETKYTRIQEYKTKDYKKILAIETSACKGVCENDLRFYRLDSGKWKDVTPQYIFQVDQKTVLKKIKDEYKSEYMDYELYESKSYDDTANFKRALNYNISPNENKIIIRDQYLPLSLYEMTWNEEKGKFDIKKL